MEVDFKRNVQYKNAKVYVKDSSGKSYKASIKKRDSDDLTFYVKSIKAGKKYTYTISGVRAGRSGSYKKVSGKFSVPAKNKVSIKSIDYDHDDRELEVEFARKVQYKSTKVSVKDSTGKSYSVKSWKGQRQPRTQSQGPEAGQALHRKGIRRSQRRLGQLHLRIQNLHRHRRLSYLLFLLSIKFMNNTFRKPPDRIVLSGGFLTPDPVQRPVPKPLH